MLDTRIPIIAGQAGQVNLADIYQQSQDNQYREQAMQMRQRQMDLQEKQMLDSLDAEKREAVKEGLKDMHAAVQWARTPEQWAQVQQSYARNFPEVMNYGFEQREQALLKLGQMGEYLEATQERFQAIEPGGSLYGINPSGDVREVVRANPGNASFGEPAGQTKTVGGKTYVKRGGQWFEEGTASNGGGGFR